MESAYYFNIFTCNRFVICNNMSTYQATFGVVVKYFHLSLQICDGLPVKDIKNLSLHLYIIR